MNPSLPLAVVRPVSQSASQPSIPGKSWSDFVFIVNDWNTFPDWFIVKLPLLVQKKKSTFVNKHNN